MKNSPEDMQKKLDLANEALEDKNQPPSGLEAINDRQKLENRAVYNAEKWSAIAPELPEAMDAYKNCEKTNLGTGIVMATGTLGVYQDASSHVSMIPGPAAAGYIIQETAKAFDKALNHVEDHNRECEIQKTLSQLDPVSYSHKLLCENTQKQAELNPFTPDLVNTMTMSLGIPPLPSRAFH
jgi:hypothetical protein